MSLGDHWFSEINQDSNSAFSLRYADHCHHELTPYQSIDIYETKSFGYLMAIDGFVMLSELDNFFYHEMMVHVPLFTHQNPKQIVIIGGGDCGSLSECLKHNVDKVIQVEIDKRVTDLSQKYFPQLTAKNHDPRAELLFEDGVAWMQNADASSVDVIIVDSTDPVGPGEGLFNQAFYEQCHRVLKADGILIQQSESPLIHQKLIHDMKQAMTQAGFHSTLTYGFPQPVYPTGFWSATMATKSTMPSTFRKNPEISETCQYYCESIHQSCMVEIPMVKRLSA